MGRMSGIHNCISNFGILVRRLYTSKNWCIFPWNLNLFWQGAKLSTLSSISSSVAATSNTYSQTGIGSVCNSAAFCNQQPAQYYPIFHVFISNWLISSGNSKHILSIRLVLFRVNHGQLKFGSSNQLWLRYCLNKWLFGWLRVGVFPLHKYNSH